MTSRLTGLDLARLLALVGMVLVHGWTDLVLLPLEAAGGPLPDGPTGPAWAVALQSVATDRARPLFVLLAGVGVTLVVARTGAGARVLLLRAAFLAALGVALLLYGWSDLVLVAYGVLFVLAVGLVRAPGALVVVLALVAWSAPVVQALLAGGPVDGGPVPVLAEFGYFFAGVALGRLDLARRGTVVRLTGAATALAVLGGAGLVAVGAPLAGWQARLTWAELGLDTVLTVGGVVAVLGACLLLGARTAAGPPVLSVPTRVLATAGSMPLSVYVAHALLYPALAPRLDADLVTATLTGAGFLVLAVAAATAWARTGRAGRPPRRGPVEDLLRRVSGPGTTQRRAVPG